MHEQTFKELKKWADNSALFLLVIYFVMLLARMNWFFDLIGNLRPQFVIGALICLSLQVRVKAIRAVILTITLIALSLFDIFRYVQIPPSGTSQDSFILTQYNALYTNRNLQGGVKEWLLKNDNVFDVVILQEATAKTAELANDIKSAYPYQLLKTREDGFGMILISRHPFIEEKIIPLQGPLFENFMFRVEIDAPNGPVTIFALHALPPMSKSSQEQRNVELQSASRIVANDKSKHVVMAGDWNITPYSPYFREVLATTGLSHHLTSFTDIGLSWPNLYGIPFLRIPIDQVLYSNSLIMQKRETGNHMGSDHRPIVAKFSYRGQ